MPVEIFSNYSVAKSGIRAIFKAFPECVIGVAATLMMERHHPWWLLNL